ncbi:MAG: hypothetical protein V4580_00315 [Bacteroidota bacterium]
MEISIKKPCHENWKAMTPNEQGAFCGKCVKTVVDFSNKSIDEIKEFFAGKQDEKVCGRFETTQLTSLSFDAFFNEFKGFNFTKRFAVILYFTFGMWLFNASSGLAQNSGHEKGDVEVVRPKTAIMGGVRAMPPKDTTKTACVKPAPEERMMKGKVYVKPVIVKEPPQKMGEVMATPTDSKPVKRPKKPAPRK